MKLLIVTQVVDTEHPILGFFHRWIEEFAKHCEQVHVICLEAGRHSLPANVTVHSLGKETGKSKFAILLRFYSLIWSLRKEYDGVFVHMNQIYVILGAPFWHALGKKVGLWYAHGSTPQSLVLAEKLTDRVFTSTPEGFRLPSKKIRIVGQGIDTSLFKPAEQKDFSPKKRLITVGRISSSKNIETLIEACVILKSKNIPFDFKIVGNAQTERDVLYEKQMKDLTLKKGLENEIVWVGGVSNFELPTYLQQADIFIHDGATNSLDKALLEASLCGCVVVSSNPAYISETKTIALEYLYSQGDSAQLARIVESADPQNLVKEKVQTHFSSRYTIQNLVSGIVSKLV